MEVLSNKEIYVLLKILNDKKVKEGSSSIVEVDKNFSLKELEHIQNEVALAENKVPEEILTIENTYKSMFGQNFHSGYKLNIVSIEAVTNYAVEYVQALAQDDLSGLTDENKLSMLMEEFYSSAKNTSDYDNFVVNEIKYMPVVLFAYINDLFELKSLTNRKYDLRREINGDVLSEKIDIRDDEIMIRMNISKLTDVLQNYGTEGKEVLKYILGNATIVNTEKVKKQPQSTASVKKSRNHMKPQQWKIFISLKKEMEKRQISNGTVDIHKDMFIMLGIFGKESGQQDTAISRFNSDYNKIMNIPKKEAEKVIWTKVSDTNWYQFSASRVTSLYNRITEPKRDDDNNALFEEFQKYKHFLNLSK